MNILIDLTFIINADISIGFTRVALSLLNSFIKLEKSSSFVLLVDKTSESYFRENYSNYLIRAITLSQIKFIDYIFSNRKRIELQRIIEDEKIDLLFCPFISARTTVIKNIPMVGILHDVQKFELYKKHKFINFIYSHKMANIIEAFNRIVTISNTERKHILSLFPHLSNRIDVIHNGISICKYEIPIQELSEVKSYILNVNTLFKYKNVLVLIKAFNEIKDKIPHFLVIKAKKTKYWEEEVAPFIRKNNLQSRVVLIERVLLDEELASLYRKADVFVSPSLMEGFGLTPVEACIYGIPVICSNIETLKESTMGLAKYFDPTEVKELSLLLEEILIHRTEDVDIKYISTKLEKEYSEIEQAKKYLNILYSYENNCCNTCVQA